ncbi:MAG TPA: TIGR03668 family PPOX class F420-dependent oxidoreductase [Stellaceae bacterium]|nr:TIGR03668 family PPOX class F420-dependent oxidoreductase [Stellaceae bacterium]
MPPGPYYVTAAKVGIGNPIGHYPAMLSTDQARFLDSSRVGHLATADRRGTPHVVPVCFVVAEGSLYITIDRKPKGDPRRLKRLRNIAANPAVAFVADRWDEDWTRLGWVMLRGHALLLEHGPEHDRAQKLLCRRYPQYRAMDLAELPVIAMRIERASSWGELSADAPPIG